MKKVGFIGYGSMGSMLLKGFLATGVLEPAACVVATRSKARLDDELKRSGVKIGTNTELASECNYIFLCVKPLEVKGVIQEILPYLNEGVHLISIAASLTIGDIEKLFKGKVTKVIPSLTSEVREGISLVCHNDKVQAEDAQFVEFLLSQLSTVKLIAEENFEAGADLTSCAPGLIAAIFQEFVNAGIRHSSLSPSEAEEMVMHTLYGTAKLLLEKQMGFDQTIARVATKGGITEEGVLVLRAGLPGIFDELFERTLGKHQKLKEMIKEQFES